MSPSLSRSLSLPLLFLLLRAPAHAQEAAAVAVVAPDRSAPPAVIPPTMLSLPLPSQKELRPGVVLSHLRVEGVRKVEVMVMFHRGTTDLCGVADPTPCRMLAQIWELASTETEAIALEARLDGLDGDLTSWLGQTSGGLELTIPRGALSEGLSLLQEVLHAPGLPRDELRRSRTDLLEWYEKSAPADLGQVAQSARQFGFYAPSTPEGVRPDLRALKRVRVKALRDLHRRLLETAPVSVLVVGDLSQAEAEAALAGVLEGVGVAGPWSVPAPYGPMGASSVVAVDMPGQSQAAIRLASAAPPRADADQVPFGALNFALGGSFTSRLNANLREEKGWTYGAGSRYAAQTTHGTWWVGVDVEAVNVAAAVAEIQAEVAGVRDQGVTDAELDAAWLDEITGWNRILETAGSAAATYQGLLLQQEAVGDRAARLTALQGLTAAALADTAVGARWLGAENPQLWVIVGDRQQIGAQVEGLGMPVQWISPEDAILGRFEVAR